MPNFLFSQSSLSLNILYIQWCISIISNEINWIEGTTDVFEQNIINLDFNQSAKKLKQKIKNCKDCEKIEIDHAQLLNKSIANVLKRITKKFEVVRMLLFSNTIIKKKTLYHMSKLCRIDGRLEIFTGSLKTSSLFQSIYHIFKEVDCIRFGNSKIMVEQDLEQQSNKKIYPDNAYLERNWHIDFRWCGFVMTHAHYRQEEKRVMKEFWIKLIKKHKSFNPNHTLIIGLCNWNVYNSTVKDLCKEVAANFEFRMNFWNDRFNDDNIQNNYNYYYEDELIGNMYLLKSEYLINLEKMMQIPEENIVK